MAWLGSSQNYLLHDLKGAMQLNGSKIMSVHVSTSTTYNQRINTSCVEGVALLRRVFLCLIKKWVISF